MRFHEILQRLREQAALKKRLEYKLVMGELLSQVPPQEVV